MKKILLFALISASAFAQGVNVRTKTPGGELTEGFTVPSGKTVTFASGSTLAGSSASFNGDVTNTGGTAFIANDLGGDFVASLAPAGVAVSSSGLASRVVLSAEGVTADNGSGTAVELGLNAASVAGTATASAGGTGNENKLVVTDSEGKIGVSLIPTEGVQVAPTRGTLAEVEAVVLGDGVIATTTDTRNIKVGDGATIGGHYIVPPGYTYDSSATTVTVAQGTSSVSLTDGGSANLIGPSALISALDGSIVAQSAFGDVELSTSIGAVQFGPSLGAHINIYGAEINFSTDATAYFKGDTGTNIGVLGGGATYVDGMTGRLAFDGVNDGVTMEPDHAFLIHTQGSGSIGLWAEGTGRVQVGVGLATTEQQGLWLSSDTALYRSAADQWSSTDQVRFTNTTASSGPTTGAAVISGGLGVGGSVFAGGGVISSDQVGTSSTLPYHSWYESDAGADMKRWQARVDGGTYKLVTRNDANSAGADALTITRAGTTPSVATFNATVSSSASGIIGSGGVAGFVSSSASPRFILNETDAGTNAKQWDVSAVTGELRFRTVNDADSDGGTWLAVTRSGITPGIATFTPSVTSTAETSSPSGLASFQAKAAGPSLELWETDGSGDAKRWGFLANSNNLLFQTKSDDGNSISSWMSVARSGASPTTVTFPATTASSSTSTGAVVVPGGVGVGGTITAQNLAMAGSGFLLLPTTAQTAEGRIWYDTTSKRITYRDNVGDKEVVSTAATQTLQNKTLASPVFTGTATAAGLDVQGALTLGTSGALQLGTAAQTVEGRLWYSGSNRVLYRDGLGGNRILVTEDITQTLSNKTLTAPVLGTSTSTTAGAIWYDTTLGLRYRGSGVDRTAVNTDVAQTLTNKTLTTPVLTSYTVATLPTGSLGMMAIVTDATAPTYLGPLTGGGAVTCPVFYNGTAWVSH